MSYSCRLHGWGHLLNPCPSCVDLRTSGSTWGWGRSGTCDPGCACSYALQVQRAKEDAEVERKNEERTTARRAAVDKALRRKALLEEVATAARDYYYTRGSHKELEDALRALMEDK